MVRIKDQIIIQPPKKVEDDSPEKVTADLGRLRMQIDPYRRVADRCFPRPAG